MPLRSSSILPSPRSIRCATSTTAFSFSSCVIFAIKFDIQFALIEKINPVPDYVLPAVSTHKLLQHYAVLKNAIAEAGIRMMEPIVARSWQAMLGCRNTGGDKSISLPHGASRSFRMSK